jgi:hypothetical protein
MLSKAQFSRTREEGKVKMAMVTMPLAQAAGVGVVGADTAWMLISTALVLLMTPALGFF